MNSEPLVRKNKEFNREETNERTRLRNIPFV